MIKILQACIADCALPRQLWLVIYSSCVFSCVMFSCHAPRRTGSTQETRMHSHTLVSSFLFHPSAHAGELFLGIALPRLLALPPKASQIQQGPPQNAPSWLKKLPLANSLRLSCRRLIQESEPFPLHKSTTERYP